MPYLTVVVATKSDSWLRFDGFTYTCKYKTFLLKLTRKRRTSFPSTPSWPSYASMHLYVKGSLRRRKHRPVAFSPIFGFGPWRRRLREKKTSSGLAWTSLNRTGNTVLTGIIRHYRPVELSDLFLPKLFSVKQRLHWSSATAHFALVRSFRVVVLKPGIQVCL